MQLKRLIDLNQSEAARIRARQKVGTMSELYDDKYYLCYDADELKSYKPRKSGRPSKKQ